MKIDFLTEFELKYTYVDNKKNWPVKQKPKIEAIDTIVISDAQYESRNKNFGGWAITSQLSKQFYQQLKIVARNERDWELLDYASWCLYSFNKRFKNQKEVDKYFGRR